MKEIEILKNGGVGVLATDTLYGVVGSALSKDAVERIYRVKKRSPSKPLIVLIGDFSDLALFSVDLTRKLQETLEEYWPGPYSIIVPIENKEKFQYLHRGTDEVAFRLPNDPLLQELLRETGPLVAPSANIEGKPPAKTIEEARAYFGDDVDFYKDSGLREGKASTLLKYEEGKMQTLRE